MLKIAAAIATCFTFFILPNHGQNSNASHIFYANLVKKQYGLDLDLVNGEQFYNRYSHIKGHPYFLNNQHHTGSLTVEGRVYENLLLKFDIHSHLVQLEYLNFSGGSNQIITVFDNVDEFTYGDFLFKKLDLEQSGEKFYQIVPTSCFTCYILWEKDLLPLNGSFTYVEQFSEEKLSLWLELSGELNEFISRKDFSGLFPEEYQKEIKRLLSKTQFKFRSASVYEIIRHLEDVCKLLEDL